MLLKDAERITNIFSVLIALFFWGNIVYCQVPHYPFSQDLISINADATLTAVGSDMSLYYESCFDSWFTRITWDVLNEIKAIERVW